MYFYPLCFGNKFFIDRDFLCKPPEAVNNLQNYLTTYKMANNVYAEVLIYTTNYLKISYIKIFPTLFHFMLLDLLICHLGM